MGPEAALAELVRVEGRRVLATLTRTLGDLRLAEDAVGDAVVVALRRWPVTGVPYNPRAWLTVAARNRAVDILRREARRPAKEAEHVADAAAREPDPPPDSVVRDDLLRLVFTCCHPALAREAQVALSLRTLGGLSTAEIAHALLVPEATLAKRLVRAKAKIAAAHIPYRVPADHELPDRLPAVLAVVYGIFTQGHKATAGEALVRVDLCDEAVRLARLLAELMPGEPEVLGLLALLLLTDARRATRVDDAGDLVLLPDQDRDRWDRARIDEGTALATEAVRRAGGIAGPYLLQALIAGLHATAPSFAATPWEGIVALYEQLERAHPSPVVALNRAAAVGEARGAAAGLAALDALAGLHGYHLWHATRAEQLRRLGRDAEAAGAYTAALACPVTEPERRFLEQRRRGVRPVGSRSSS